MHTNTWKMYCVRSAACRQHGRNQDCTHVSHGVFVASAKQTLPQALTVGRVQMLLGDKVVWQGAVEPSENYMEADCTLRTTARDCFQLVSSPANA